VALGIGVEVSNPRTFVQAVRAYNAYALRVLSKISGYGHAAAKNKGVCAWAWSGHRITGGRIARPCRACCWWIFLDRFIRGVRGIHLEAVASAAGALRAAFDCVLLDILRDVLLLARRCFSSCVPLRTGR